MRDNHERKINPVGLQMSAGQLAVVITHVLRCVAAASPRKWVSAADVKPVAIKKQTRRSVSLVLCFLYFFLASFGNLKSNFQGSEGVT